MADPPVPTPWLDGATAYLSCDFERAAEIYERMHELPDEAYARLRAAAVFVDEGRRSDADRELERALGFFRSVDATRYIREGEALLAAAG